MIPSPKPITYYPNVSAYQDVGLDGLDNDQERSFFDKYLNELRNMLAPSAFEWANDDPSSDDYKYYLGSDHDMAEVDILDRYKKYNGIEGNALGDNEDLNGEFDLNETEAYFQYRIPLDPGMNVGHSFITTKQEAVVRLPNGAIDRVTWYQFKVPIREYDHTVGNIPDFKDIKAIRLFLTGFDQPVVLRFAELELSSPEVINCEGKARVYPNPVRDEFCIDFNSNPIRVIKIYNAIGQLVYQDVGALSNCNHKVPMNMRISRGVYILKVETGACSSVTKFILQ